MKTDCNVCNFAHVYESDHTRVYVCMACSSLLERGVSYDTISPSRVDLPEEDMSPIQIGTCVIVKQEEYRVIGRWAYRLNNGHRNKWLMLNSNNQPYFLIESSGFYAICVEDQRKLSKNDLVHIKPGGKLELENNTGVYLDTLSQNKHTYYQGELTAFSDESTSFFSFDFSNAKGKYAFAQLYTKEHIALFKGAYYTFNQLQFKNLRESDVWK